MKCIGDGGFCGLGGYCSECPWRNTKTYPLSTIADEEQKNDEFEVVEETFDKIVGELEAENERMREVLEKLLTYYLPPKLEMIVKEALNHEKDNEWIHEKT